MVRVTDYEIHNLRANLSHVDAGPSILFHFQLLRNDLDREIIKIQTIADSLVSLGSSSEDLSLPCMFQRLQRLYNVYTTSIQRLYNVYTTLRRRCMNVK